jgi:hypothetical protein
VFMDNVSVHKVDGIEEAIEARGAIPFYLPAYSPDLNPIEQLFEIVLIRPQSMRERETRLRNIIYVHTGDGYMVRTECNEVLDVTEHYGVGQIVKVRIPDPDSLRGYQKSDSRASIIRGIPFGLLEPHVGDKPCRTFQVGEHVAGVVVCLSSGAFILVDDYCLVFLPSTLVMSGKKSCSNSITVWRQS